MAEWRAVKGHTHALLVHGVAGLMQGRKQRVAEIVLAHARGYADVTGREPRAKRMMCLVETTAVEVVAHALRNPEAERELRRLAKGLAQAAIVRGRLLRNRTHQRHELASQRLEHFLYR